MGFEVDVIRSEGKGGEGAEVAENGVEAITKLVMEGEFRVVNAVEEVVTEGIKAGAAETGRRG